MKEKDPGKERFCLEFNRISKNSESFYFHDQVDGRACLFRVDGRCSSDVTVLRRDFVSTFCLIPVKNCVLSYPIGETVSVVHKTKVGIETGRFSKENSLLFLFT